MPSRSLTSLAVVAAVAIVGAAICPRWFRARAVSGVASDPATYYAYTVDYPPVYELRGYDFVSRLEIFRPFDDEVKSFSFRRPEGEYRLTWRRVANEVELARDGSSLIRVPVSPILDRAAAFLSTHRGARAGRLPQAILTLSAENDRVRVKLFFDDISARRTREGLCLYHFKADVLVGLKAAIGALSPKNNSEIVSNR